MEFNMEWTIPGLIVLFLIVFYFKMSDLHEEVGRLKREQKQSADTTSETLKQKDSLIGELEHDLRELKVHDTALQAKIKDDHDKREASQTSSENSYLDLIFTMAYFAQSIYTGEDNKKIRDLMLLEFLGRFQEFITCQQQSGGNEWKSIDLGRMTSKRDIELSHLRGMLLDLMKHHNTEYVAILDEFPSGVAMEFLRLTVAEPVAASG